MKKVNDPRVEKAMSRALECFDYILEVRPEPKYVEIVASVGGDVIRRRYYDNGMECDK